VYTLTRFLSVTCRFRILILETGERIELIFGTARGYTFGLSCTLRYKAIRVTPTQVYFPLMLELPI